MRCHSSAVTYIFPISIICRKSVSLTCVHRRRCTPQQTRRTPQQTHIFWHFLFISIFSLWCELPHNFNHATKLCVSHANTNTKMLLCRVKSKHYEMCFGFHLLRLMKNLNTTTKWTMYFGKSFVWKLVFIFNAKLRWCCVIIPLNDNHKQFCDNKIDLFQIDAPKLREQSELAIDFC